MLDSFLLVAGQVLMLFILVGVGFVCNRRRLVDARAVRGLVDILVVLVTPCLIVHVFQRPFERHLMTGLGWAFVMALFAHGVGILAAFLLRLRDKTRESVLRYAVIFSNAGFMGIPLEQAILGDTGVLYGAVYVAVFNLLCWSYGLVVMCGSVRDLKVRALFVNSGTIGLAVGLPLFILSVKLPPLLATPVKMMADLNTPLAMIVIGWYLAQAEFGAMLRLPAAHLATGLRLVAVPLTVVATFFLVCRLIVPLDRVMMLAIVTAASAPAAALTTMLAARYNRDVAVSVGVVAVSTLLSALSMPLIVGLALHVLPG